MEGKIHVLALPFPAEGHITPLLHFTKRLACRGFQVTLVIPSITIKSKAAAQLVPETSNFKIRKISDGTENENGKEISSVEAYFSRSKAEISKNLDLLIRELGKSNQIPDVLVYDSIMPWALEIAHHHGFRAAPFFTESCAVNYIYYNIFQGTLELSSANIDGGSVISLPPLPPLEIKDLPCCPTFGCFQHYVIEKFFPDQFLNLHKADWILINTLDNLENQLASWIKSRWPFKTIGPTILKGDDDGLIINGTKDDPKKESDYNSCIEWLDRREVNSVVYVSFGTVAELSEEQMEEVGRGLISSNCNFLWTLRAEEGSKLPAKIRSEISSSGEKGLILEWCPQLEVLGHEAVACFVTHCGWNSTIEALSSGVPMIAMPCLVDQMTNAKFIADVWEVGVRVKADSKGSFSSEEIEMCIKEVTQSKRGKELKQNVLKWKQEIEKAIAPGGSSSKNIDDFVAELSWIKI